MSFLFQYVYGGGAEVLPLRSCLVYLIAIISINHTYNNIKYLCQAYNSVAFPVTA